MAIARSSQRSRSGQYSRASPRPPPLLPGPIQVSWALREVGAELERGWGKFTAQGLAGHQGWGVTWWRREAVLLTSLCAAACRADIPPLAAYHPLVSAPRLAPFPQRGGDRPHSGHR